MCGCIYRTQSNDYDKKGCEKSTKGITQLIRAACDRNKSVLIAGDFNYKEIDWEMEYAPHPQDFVETLEDCFLYQHVTEPTRYREGERSNLLDKVLSTDEVMVQDLSYHPPLGESDHVIIRFNMPLHQSRKIDDLSDQYNIIKANYEGIREELKNRTWNEMLSSIFEQDYDIFLETLETALKSYTPLQTLPQKKRNIYIWQKKLSD